MTLKLNFMLFAAITVMMTACDKNDEPLNRTQFEIERETPVRATPLLAYYAQQHDGLTMWPSTVVDDSRLTGEAGDFTYWQEHKNEAQTIEELMAMCDIPSDKLYAMSTRNLARTCYNHPYTFVYTAQNVIYQGFFFMTQANCYRELMQRKSGAQELLNLYCELEYTTIGFQLNALSLFLMTAVDYNALNQEQLARLSAEIFNKIDNIIDVEGSTPVFSENLRFTYLLGAFIAYHYDASLSDDDVNLLKAFITVTGLPGFSVKGVIITAEEVSQATLIISQSLERMGQMSIS